MEPSRAMSEERTWSLLGRHFESQDSDSAAVRELRVRAQESVAAVNAQVLR